VLHLYLRHPKKARNTLALFGKIEFMTKPNDHYKPLEFLGHPKGLSLLFLTEMWERFSFYGMRALLILYMVKFLLLPENSQVIGMDFMRAFFEIFSGPLSHQAFASEIYGLYTALVYLTPLFGGWLADHKFGQRAAIIFGAILMAIGHLMMAFPPMTFIALVMLILGNGAFKPNISSQVGRLYASNDRRRDRAYAIFYVGINTGAFLSPLICGTLGEEYGWHYGFMAAGIGMMIALFCYLHAQPNLPPDTPLKSGRMKIPLTTTERNAVLALILIYIPTIFFWAAFEQQGNTIALWTNDNTNRYVDFLIWRGDIPVTWFQALNPLFVFVLSPLIIKFWSWQSDHGREPCVLSKMSIGCSLVALAYLILALAAWLAQGEKASAFWLLLYFVIITIGELYLSPLGLSLVSTLAPATMISTMMGFWFAASFIGNIGAGYLGTFWEAIDKPRFFLLIASVAAIGTLLILCLKHLINPYSAHDSNNA